MTSAGNVEARLSAALLRRAQRLGPALARLADERGLAVVTPDGARRAIPIALLPVILDERELVRRQRLARLLSSAGVAMARLALARPELRARMLGALSPLEAALAVARPLTMLATTRVDFFEGASLQALELNATIPAMQGYSDIAARALVDVIGDAAGVDAATRARWLDANGSNTGALYQALLAGYARVRPGQTPGRMAILCRRNDAQLTELAHLRARFSELGTPTDVIHPDLITGGDDDVRVGSRRYDLVYRHLFVRRIDEPGVDPRGEARRLLFDEVGARAVLLNPAASVAEVKSVFALLTSSVVDDELAAAAGLTDDERGAVAEAVPWTRELRGAELVARVAGDPDRYVLKRAWDYGGRAVFIGRDRTAPGFAERVRAAWPDLEPSWSEVCARAAADERGGGFVAQEIVDAQPRPNLLCTTDGVTALDLTVDFSAYASVGLGVDPPWGAVCRGAPSRIVNIVGGGGVVPVLRSDVARALADALAA